MSESILHDSERGETQGGLAGVLSWRGWLVGWLVVGARRLRGH